MADWETARSTAGSFPAEESASYGQPAFKVREAVPRVSPDRAAGGALATYVDEAGKEVLIDSQPEDGYDNALATKESIVVVNAFRLVSHA